MRRVILIRHGESAINAENKTVRRLCGQVDTPLTEYGREQARRVGRFLADRVDLEIAYAISSNLERARDTCEIILQQLAYNPQQLPPTIAFNERSLGHFEGQLESDVYRDFPQFQNDPLYCRFREDFEQKAPGGENLTDVTQRAWSEFQSILTRTSGNLLIVSHYNTIKCLIGRALQLPNSEILQLRVQNAIPHILCADVEPGDRFQMETFTPW